MKSTHTSTPTSRQTFTLRSARTSTHPSMFRSPLLLAILAGTAGLCAAQTAVQNFPQNAGPEMGRVLSSTPMVSQVGVPRRVCTNESVPTQTQKSGAGAVMGGLAGGAIGNAIGGGGGRAAATVIGIFGGAILGDRIEGGGQTQYQTVQNCTSQTFYENRTTSYNVVYEYAGKQYSVHMPNDPGPFVRLQVTPVGATQFPGAAPQYVQPQAAAQDGAEPALVYSNSQVITNQVIAQQQAVPVYVAAAPVVYAPVLTAPYGAVYPAYYARPYYPPVGVSLNFGWSGGGYNNGYRHGYRHGHSR